jgi:hypothetical protein
VALQLLQLRQALQLLVLLAALLQLVQLHAYASYPACWLLHLLLAMHLPHSQQTGMPLQGHWLSR